jgi:hypothetical protein
MNSSAAIDPESLKGRGPWGWPKASFGSRARITREEFEALPVANHHDWLPGSYKDYKVLIGGRWHLCNRQAHFGQSVVYVSPIVVIVRA